MGMDASFRLLLDNEKVSKFSPQLLTPLAAIATMYRIQLHRQEVTPTKRQKLRDKKISQIFGNPDMIN
jgi:hypothetical protein